MNRKLIYSLLTVAALAVAATSCSETDGTSVVPRFEAITCEPATPAPGDSVTLTAHQSVKGKLINSTTYRWAFTYTDAQLGRDTTVVRNVEVIYDLEGGADPVVGFRIPADTPGRRLGVGLTAYYSLSGQTELGQIFGQASMSTSINLAQ